MIEIRKRGGEVAPEGTGAITAALTARGWCHRVVDRSEIEHEPTFNAIRTVQRRRRTAVTAADVVHLRQLLRQGSRPLAHPKDFGRVYTWNPVRRSYAVLECTQPENASGFSERQHKAEVVDVPDSITATKEAIPTTSDRTT